MEKELMDKFKEDLLKINLIELTNNEIREDLQEIKLIINDFFQMVKFQKGQTSYLESYNDKKEEKENDRT